MSTRSDIYARPDVYDMEYQGASNHDARFFALFAGLGILIDTAVAHAETAVSGISGAQIAFGLQVAFFVALSLLLAADIFFNANPLPRKHARVDRASAWRRRIVVFALVFLAGGVAVLIAATGEPSDAPACGAECGTPGQAIAVVASINLPNATAGAHRVRDVVERTTVAL
jgi:hypothetical protein